MELSLFLFKSDIIVQSSSVNVFNNSLVKVLGGMYILQTERFFPLSLPCNFKN